MPVSSRLRRAMSALAVPVLLPPPAASTALPFHPLSGIFLCLPAWIHTIDTKAKFSSSYDF